MTLRVRLALATALTATIATLGVVLSRAPLVLAGTDGIPAKSAVTFIHRSETRCQGGGTLPAGTVAIRVSLSANAGPGVSLWALSGSRVITRGERGAGWGTDETVTVPVQRVPETVGGTSVCVAIGPPAEGIQVNGAPVQTSAGGRAIWLRLEYLRPGTRSWASLAASVARHMGIGHTPGGAWAAFSAIAAMLAVCVIVSRALLSDLP
ncbi:MAG TPA: hypothetical protein VK272_04550 [Solirubrobacteraceae bacterium]|nr:hypothetical protein [Solirubrobacteraceae bacterium]